MGVLPKLFKLWPSVDLDLFYAKVKFGHIGFCMGKSENYLFFGNYCSLGSQSCWKHLAKWVNEVEWVSKVKVILWPWSKVTQISKLNFWLWPIYSGERFRASWPSCFYFYFKFGLIESKVTLSTQPPPPPKRGKSVWVCMSVHPSTPPPTARPLPTPRHPATIPTPLKNYIWIICEKKITYSSPPHPPPPSHPLPTLIKILFYFKFGFIVKKITNSSPLQPLFPTPTISPTPQIFFFYIRFGFFVKIIHFP